MTWKDRLQPDIRMTSPEGDEFTAQWRGDPRSKETKLGIFEFPGLVGATVQDLRVGADRGTLSFFFEGADHDLEADRFFKSVDQMGLWQIVHPMYGAVSWQFMSVKEDDQPVESANMTAFKIEWIEPLGIKPDVSIAQVVASVADQAVIVRDKANEQTEDSAEVTRPSDITRFKTAIREAADTVKIALAPITETVAEVNAQVESVYRAIQESLGSAVFSVTGLAGQVQVLIALPGQIEGDLTTRLKYYTDLLEDVTTLTDSEQSDTTVNDAVVRDLTATTVLSSIADVVVNNTPRTKEEALSALTSVSSAFDQALVGLDRSQTSLSGEYVSQSESFNDTSLLLAGVSDLLLRKSFDLSTAKMITLNRHRTPVEIAMTEGVDTDEFIATNALKGVDILLLPPGRTVVVYS